MNFQSFNNGFEILRGKKLDKDIFAILEEIGTLQGHPKEENRRIQSIFINHGWHREKKLVKGGYRIDFFKEKVGVEVALSLFEEIFKDLIKLMYAADIEGYIDIGVIIVPETPLRNNPANTHFDNVCKTLRFFERVIRIPIVCFSLDGFVVGKLPLGTSERDAVLKAILEKPGITQGEIKKRYGISTTSVFISLEKENKIRREYDGQSFRLYPKY